MEEQENHEVHEEEYQLDDEVDIEEVAVAAYNRVDAFVELLVKKGVITETELDLMEDSMVEEDDDEEHNQNSTENHQ